MVPENENIYRLEDLRSQATGIIHTNPYILDMLERFKFALERPIGTLKPGGVPRDFITADPPRRVRVRFGPRLFDIPIQPRRFHVLDAIGFAVRAAPDPEAAEQAAMPLIGFAPPLRRTFQPMTLLPPVWILPSELDPDHEARVETFVAELKKKWPGVQPAVAVEPKAQTATSKKRRTRSQQCFAPSERVGGYRAAPLGYVAQHFIEADFCGKTGAVPGVSAYFDESMPSQPGIPGGIDPNYIRFIFQRNPALAPEAKVFLTDPQKRPDILLHLGDLREFEEIKPDSGYGLAAGYRKIFEIDFWMSVFNLYTRGKTYTPTPYIPIATLPINGEPESPWVRWRVGGLGSGGLAGLLKAIVPALKFSRWEVTDGSVQAAVIPPLDPSRGGELYLLERPPGTLAVD